MSSWKVTEENGIRRFGPALLYKKKGIDILHVKGNEYQMGYRHGMPLKHEMLDGALDFVPKYIESLISHSSFGKPGWLIKVVFKLLYFFVIRRQTENIPGEYLAVYYGIADVIGKKRSWIKNMVSFADFA